MAISFARCEACAARASHAARSLLHRACSRASHGSRL